MVKNFLRIFIVATFFLFASNADANWVWTKMNKLFQHKRDKACAFVLQGKGFVFGGSDSLNHTLNDLWMFDPTSNTWTQKASLDTLQKRRNAFAFSLGDSVGIVAGGASDSTNFYILSSVYGYNYAANAWSTKTSMPANVLRATAVSCNGKGYVIGGSDGFNPMSAIYEYDGNLNLWNVKTSMVPQPPGSSGGRDFPASFVVENKIYFGTGKDDSYYDNHFWVYDPVTDSWQQKADFLGGRRMGCVAFALGNTGVIGLGTDGGNKIDLYGYDATNDVWNFLANYPNSSGLKNACAFVINGDAYIATGNSGKVSDVCYKLSLSNGIATMSDAKNIVQIFPQPAHQSVIFKTDKSVENGMITIFSADGKLIAQQAFHSTQTKFETKTWQPDFYFYQISKDEKIIAFGKILVQ